MYYPLPPVNHHAQVLILVYCIQILIVCVLDPPLHYFCRANPALHLFDCLNRIQISIYLTLCTGFRKYHKKNCKENKKNVISNVFSNSKLQELKNN